MHRLQKCSLGELGYLLTLGSDLVGDGERLGQGFGPRPSNLFGEAGERGTEHIVVVGGNDGAGDGDANRGADFAGRVVDCRRDALLLVRDRAHDR